MQTIFKQGKLAILAVLLSLVVLPYSTANAATVSWEFNLPATGNPSVDPPYESVALLTLEDSTCGAFDCVKFTLDPNESNPGYKAQSDVNRLNIVFSTTFSDEDDRSPTDIHAFSLISGNAPKKYDWLMPPSSNDANMDSSYKSQAGQIQLDWKNGDLPIEDITMWTILNTTIADNFSISASANNKPGPVFGIISVSPITTYDIDGKKINPSPSNWVTGPSPVPVPAAFWLFGTALIGFIGFSRRTKV